MLLPMQCFTQQNFVSQLIKRFTFLKILQLPLPGWTEWNKSNYLCSLDAEVTSIVGQENQKPWSYNHQVYSLIVIPVRWYSETQENNAKRRPKWNYKSCKFLRIVV